MDSPTREMIRRIREGESRLDHSKYATRYIANLLSNAIEVSEMLAHHLNAGNREAALHDLTHVEQRLAALRDAINGAGMEQK